MRLDDLRIAGVFMALCAGVLGSPTAGVAAPVHTAVPPLPARVDSLYVRLTANMQPAVRRWMALEAGKIARSPLSATGAVAVIRSDARARFGAQLRTGADQDAVTFVVLTDATNLIRQSIATGAPALGGMESLRLQMAMDRVSKMMATLSGIEKKMSDPPSSIAQNLK